MRCMARHEACSGARQLPCPGSRTRPHESRPQRTPHEKGSHEVATRCVWRRSSRPPFECLTPCVWHIATLAIVQERTAQAPMSSGAPHALVQAASDAALSYAWCKVCFVAWDETLEAAGERILRYSHWPESLKALLAALYPAYFVFSGVKRLHGPHGPAQSHAARRFTLVLAVACAVAAHLGRRSGRTARKATV